MFAYIAALALFAGVAFAVPADELTFAKIAAFPNLPGTPNATGQYDFAFARGSPTLPLGPPGGLSCNNANYFTCFTDDNIDPYKRPFLALSDEYLTVTWKQKPRWAGKNITTYQNKKPVSVQAFLCYTAVAATDRAWRGKNKAYPRLSQQCPFGFEVLPFDSDPAHVYTSTYQFEWGEVMPTATLYVSIWIRCDDGTVCAFDNTDSATYKNYIQSEVYQTVTTPMIVAASILSIFSWIIFFGFFTFDNYYYKKHGKAFCLF